MNETYKWLYDYYALPLMKVGKQADALKERRPGGPCCGGGFFEADAGRH